MGLVFLPELFPYMKHRFFYGLLILFLLTLNLFLPFSPFQIANPLMAMDSYDIKFEGEINQETLSTLQCASQLLSQKESPPATGAGLRHRAESDAEKFLKILHSQAYYNAKIDLNFDFEQKPPLVSIEIETGPIYPLASFSIVPAEGCIFSYESICLDELGILIGQAALPKNILDAEEALLEIMEAKGYPMASIKQREVVADQCLKSVSVTLHVDSGPTAFFGETTISGACSVKKEFFDKKISWKEAKVYDPCRVERTQRLLEASGLFSSILITHGEEMNCEQQLPMMIEVEEAKHRSIGGGLAYTTERGPGLTAEWEHRNIRGMGEKLSIDVDLWNDLQEVTFLYAQPDYRRRAQDLLWLLEYRHETTRGFREYAFSLSRMIEKQVNERIRLSYGGMYKRLVDTHADGNGRYNLFKVPFHLRWSNADSLLDPTKGSSINFKAIPSFQFPEEPFAYCINTLSTTWYKSLTEDSRYIWASKLLLGSIWGSSRRTIPASERFYEGSENVLRGYRFLTVSPLNHDHKPIGGRSMMVLSQELRVRATETFGYVIFYDVGNVYSEPVPKLSHKVLQSIGVGLRYHTPVGPLRLDFAVPLNRRSHLDNRFQIYLSIGQAF